MKDRIKLVRQAASKNQSEFGAVIGVSGAAVSRWEAGDRSVPDSAILSICRCFNVNETWLRTGDGQMYADKDRARQMEELVQSLMADSPESFRSALITTLLRFRPDGPEWEVLERIYQSVAASVPAAGNPGDAKAERASIHAELDRQLDEEEKGQGISSA